MATEKERMLRGDLYRDNDPELLAERRACRTLIARYNDTAPDADGERREILDRLLGSCGADTVIVPPLRCDYGHPIRIGTNTFLNYDAVILDCAPVTIGNDVSIGPRVQILTPLHPMEDHELRRARWESAAPITIGDNAWLGGGVIVCAGVTIGENTVIGAGSVVTRDIPPRVFAAGNPCRVIRDL
ncbi:sugar O-acetyltransferase [Nocardia jinanensis]|uniref:Maltose O-acetyltransferase n=1 Tax=Nocardia jinanensis TaxID=382504 RepID=A0A917RTL0_9NOCA|nr:sugar O-acetyltransferase [Nocardia jinanensis]GGL27071.1 maltose O-acetyltransferase [Nocardia jinanensis]